MGHEMGINLEKCNVSTYLLYTCLFFPHGWKSVGFLPFSFKKKKTTWRPKKSARSFPSILRWSGGWSESWEILGSIRLFLMGLQSMELLVERFNKKISQNSVEIKKGFRNRSFRCQLQQRFICGWWLDLGGILENIFDNTNMASNTQPLYISCGGYLYDIYWKIPGVSRFTLYIA